MSTTLGQALEAAAARLAPRSEHARTDAEELLGRLLGLGRSRLYLDRERALSDDEASTLERWVSRRVAGEPIQYITGRAAFRELDLAVTPAVLIPRPETEILVEAVLGTLRRERGRWPRPRVLDLGTGSGAIALAIASENPDARVTATDLSGAALERARVNAESLGLAPRVRFERGDWFDAVAPDERFEAVVANPPYIAESERGVLPSDVRDHEPALALYAGESGLEALRTIVDEAPLHLVAEGLLALELADTRALTVRDWLEGSRDWREVALRNDLAGKPRVLCARREAGPAIAPAQWPEDP